MGAGDVLGADTARLICSASAFPARAVSLLWPEFRADVIARGGYYQERLRGRQHAGWGVVCRPYWSSSQWSLRDSISGPWNAASRREH